MTRTCPVETYASNGTPVPALGLYTDMDARQDRARPVLWSDEAQGYWVFTDNAVILDGLQQPDLWSSSVIVPTEQDPPYKWIPVMLDPPEHTRWRQLLGSWFTPKRIKQMIDDQHRLAIEIVERVATRGECDFTRDVAQVFPATIFLDIMGMPLDKLDEFLEWEHMILHQDGESDPDHSIRMAGMGKVMTYFAGLVAERRAHPDPDAHDIVSSAVSWEIDGEAVDDRDVLNCLLLLFMAGLDTVANQVTYAMHHLATHPDDRAWVVAEPALVPRAVEEVLRVYPIVQTARKATRDTDFHGCPVKAGDMALFPLAAAGRDPQAYDDARTVDLDRGVTRHMSFGAGPHRCLGSHLARQEMAVLLEEWHKLVPDYELVDEPQESGGGVWGLQSLKLRWSL
ncbi:cytochrome P450 [Pseudonocardia sp.]|jgi:cytochrome P450|uniref:cytochrome P450 n=1 Tax=Pseudonocardia sp. TaxID=60912 RepID=UPI00261DB377|nr:cytochrome P450 [Pseudonocardia sp.]MCW2721758.1 putative cytochrome [Pseudonocardia sp.]